MLINQLIMMRFPGDTQEMPRKDPQILVAHRCRSFHGAAVQVGFTDRERLLGDSALALVKSNAKCLGAGKSPRSWAFAKGVPYW